MAKSLILDMVTSTTMHSLRKSLPTKDNAANRARTSGYTSVWHYRSGYGFDHIVSHSSKYSKDNVPLRFCSHEKFCYLKSLVESSSVYCSGLPGTVGNCRFGGFCWICAGMFFEDRGSLAGRLVGWLN